MRRSKPDLLFDTANVALMIILLILWVYPLYFIVIASVSDPYAVVTGKTLLFPRGLTLDAYKNVFQNQQIWVGYGNTAFYTVAGTLFNLILTIPAAYALSKKNLKLRTLSTWVFLFTMFFSGGLVPNYLLARDLRLLNTRWALVLLGGVSVYNIVVTRTYFANTIPEEMYEAGKIDGARELTMFRLIALPLAAPIIAVMALYYGVGHWNNYFDALIYVSDKGMEPLQLVLRKILILNQTALSKASATTQDTMALAEMARRQYLAEGMKYAVVFIASAPLLCAYPFVQKYFVKGVMIGSLKG